MVGRSDRRVVGMKIKRFEDIEGWQEARVLARMVYAVSSKGRFARDFRLRGQIEDAAVSVMANIAEGFDAGSDAEFIRFFWVCPAFGQ